MLRQIIAPAARSMIRTNRSAAWQVSRKYHDADHHQTTMDDLPVPQGSWETNYKNQQTKYNMHLLMGIVFFSVTIITAKASGLVYLNYSPPQLKD